MAEQDLHDAGVDAVLHQPGGIGVPQAVRGDARRHRGRRRSGGEAPAQDAFSERRVAATIGE